MSGQVDHRVMGAHSKPAAEQARLRVSPHYIWREKTFRTLSLRKQALSKLSKSKLDSFRLGSEERARRIHSDTY